MNEELTIPKLFDSWIISHGPKTAIIGASKNEETFRASYADLGILVDRARSGIAALGLSKGDKVVIGGPNTPQWGIMLIAAACEGIVLVPLDTRSERSFVERVVKETGSRFAFLSTTDTSLREVLSIPFYIITELLNESGSSANRPSTVSPDDLYAIIYTSGTTSIPKGVMLTHRNIASNIESLTGYLDIGSDHRFLSVLPLAHVLEQVGGFLSALVYGYTIIYPSSREPETLSSLMVRYKTTAMVVVPYILERMQESMTRKHKEKHVSTLVGLIGKLPMPLRRAKLSPFRGPHRTTRIFISAGAPLLHETRLFWEMMGVTVLQGYGLTETSPVLTIETPRARKAGSAGKTIPDVVLRIAPDGEILAKGPNVFSGYYKNAEATKSALSDGWFSTGDMGEIDSEGYLTIRGRKKYMFLDSRGINIYPEDIEAVLNVMDTVKDSCVIATGNEGRIEITGVIVPKEASSFNLEDAKKSANENLGNHQQIAHLILWDENEFPKTPSLKNKRELIRARIFA